MVVGLGPAPALSKKAQAALKKQQALAPITTTKGVDPTLTTVAKKEVHNDEKEGRPDKAAYDQEQEALKKEIDQIQAKVNEIKAKITSLSSAKGSPTNVRKSELRAKLDELRNDQARIKGGRGKTLDQVKAMQESVGKKIKELQETKSKSKFKTVAEVDAQIATLDKQVSSGTLSLVTEKRHLMEISSLRKSRKTVESFSATQFAIDEDKGKIDEIRKGMEDPEAKRINDEFGRVKAELDEINKKGEEGSKERDGLFEERNRLSKELDEVYTKKKESASVYREANNKFYQKMNEDRSRRLEKQKAERSAFEETKRSELNSKLLEEAQAPAFEREIEDCRNLIDFFKRRIGQASSSVENGGTAGAEREEVKGVKKLELRQVEGEVPKGAVALKKKGEQEEEYFMGGGGKKGKKGANKKVNGATEGGEVKETKEETLNLPFGTLSALLTLGITSPTKVGQVEETIKALEMKKKYFSDNQDRVTKEKIAAVEKKIKAAEAKSSSSSATKAADNTSATAATEKKATEGEKENTPAVPVAEEKEKAKASEKGDEEKKDE